MHKKNARTNDSAAGTIVAFRIDDQTEDKLSRLVAEQTARSPGARVTRGSVARWLLSLGLEALEAAK